MLSQFNCLDLNKIKCHLLSIWGQLSSYVSLIIPSPVWASSESPQIGGLSFPCPHNPMPSFLPWFSSHRLSPSMFGYKQFQTSNKVLRFIHSTLICSPPKFCNLGVSHISFSIHPPLSILLSVLFLWWNSYLQLLTHWHYVSNSSSVFLYSLLQC